MLIELDVLYRIAIAILCGFCIGLERQLTGHIAGIKTNILISLGSCIFVLFSFLSGDDDITRIAAQVVTGVGFLCSSVIIKNGISVNGLNTSATIWCTSGVGIISSLGLWKISIVITMSLILANLLFYPLAEKIPVLRKFNDENESSYKVCISCDTIELLNMRKFIVDTIDKSPFILTSIEVKSNDDNFNKTNIKITINYIGKTNNCLVEDLVSKLYENKEILNVNWKIN